MIFCYKPHFCYLFFSVHCEGENPYLLLISIPGCRHSGLLTTPGHCTQYDNSTSISTPCPLGVCMAILYSLLSCNHTTCLIILLSASLVWVIRKISLPPTSPDAKFYIPFKGQRSWLAHLYLPSSQLHRHTCSAPVIWCRSCSPRWKIINCGKCMSFMHG